MPTIPQRDALDTLTKVRLTELADSFELEVPARSSKSEFVDALAASRRSSYERILEALSRAELKAIQCFQIEAISFTLDAKELDGRLRRASFEHAKDTDHFPRTKTSQSEGSRASAY